MFDCHFISRDPGGGTAKGGRLVILGLVSTLWATPCHAQNRTSLMSGEFQRCQDRMLSNPQVTTSLMALGSSNQILCQCEANMVISVLSQEEAIAALRGVWPSDFGKRAATSASYCLAMIGN